MNQKIIRKRYAGLFAIGIFIVWILLSELGTMILGGDLGSFLYVSFHFILNPLVGLVVIVFAIWHCFKINQVVIKSLNIVACIIPCFIIYTGITGDFLLSDFLSIGF